MMKWNSGVLPVRGGPYRPCSICLPGGLRYATLTPLALCQLQFIAIFTNELKQTPKDFNPKIFANSFRYLSWLIFSTYSMLRNARSGQDWGLQSIGYQLPPPRIRLNILHLALPAAIAIAAWPDGIERCPAAEVGNLTEVIIE